jgi:methyl-accepting chemotaxis protein
MIRQIKRACDEQRRGSGQIMTAMENIQNAAMVNMESTQVMNNSLENLADQTEVLKQEMNAFRIKE